MVHALVVGVAPPTPGRLFDLEAVAKLIGLPSDHCMGPMIAVGKRTKDPWPKPGQLPLDEVMVVDRFPG